jgi:hypothetical protein
MIQFAKHKKIKKQEDKCADTLFLLRIGNKILIYSVTLGGVTETKFGAETEERTI